MSPLARFLAAAAVIWLCSWLPIGLWVGDWDYVLTPVSRDTTWRQLYQVLLYGGLLVVFGLCWRKEPPPKPGWGSSGVFLFFFIQGLIATAVFRWALSALGYAQWQFSGHTILFWAQVVISCIAVGLVEEAVFRGFLLGHLVARLGWRRGVWLSSLVFALVHLFRPGTLQFKLCYGIGLILLGYLLARLAWHHNAVGASAGFHSGIILFNIATTLSTFEPNYLSGWNLEPVSGALSWIFTLGFLGLWKAGIADRVYPPSTLSDA